MSEEEDEQKLVLLAQDCNDELCGKTGPLIEASQRGSLHVALVLA